jgi:UDP-N-acetylglucosamine 2-epimerase (non-hydrolysing)
MGERVVLSVVGARPNFMKIAPIVAEMAKRPALSSILVHTGQHYDSTMSSSFFADLAIPEPDHNLGVGAGSPLAQTAETMRRLEPILSSTNPDVVVVVGDVTSTVAAALAAAKLAIPVVHVEAGLRSFDRTMPEEINRIVTDALSDHFFVTEDSGKTNLLNEGKDPATIHMVGNVMIDTLDAMRQVWAHSGILAELGLAGRDFALLTLHRPANVDDSTRLDIVLEACGRVAQAVPVVFPVHPRVRERLLRRPGFTWIPRGGSASISPGINCLDALGYPDFVALLSHCRLTLTDSGGVQEEATVLGVPCLTLRDNTERPVTLTHGTNRLVGRDPERIVAEALRVLRSPSPRPSRPPLWDGLAAVRIVDHLEDLAQVPCSCRP